MYMYVQKAKHCYVSTDTPAAIVHVVLVVLCYHSSVLQFVSMLVPIDWHLPN